MDDDCQHIGDGLTMCWTGTGCSECKGNTDCTNSKFSKCATATGRCTGKRCEY